MLWRHLIEQLSTEGFKPKLTLQADGEFLYVYRQVKDVATFELTNTLAKFHLPAYLDDGAACLWIFQCIHESLGHELAHFFKRDGKQLYDPHALDHLYNQWLNQKNHKI